MEFTNDEKRVVVRVFSELMKKLSSEGNNNYFFGIPFKEIERLYYKIKTEIQEEEIAQFKELANKYQSLLDNSYDEKDVTQAKVGAIKKMAEKVKNIGARAYAACGIDTVVKTAKDPVSDLIIVSEDELDKLVKEMIGENRK